MDKYDHNPAFRAMLAYRAQDWLLDQSPIPNGAEAYRTHGLAVVQTLLGEPLERFIETIVEELVEIDAWNK